ncbi:hypothetical protein EVJ58_g6446 [Rhodofomes roseus]|uniref:G-protein coupled receptors family 1 profile domain-containing protein n=1 Tax=Rhodofomes roseus TaxID=34475 RepID=A0A4Y9Y7B1_9APHY|nr:hypothetical protein EVJ58_g6446 [Rhodofomes roseus]
MRVFGGVSGRLPGRYSSSEAASLVAVIVFASVSILAVGGFLAYVARLSLHAFLAKRPGGRQQAQEQRTFFQTQLGAYTVSLLLSNFLTSIALIFNAHWIQLGGVRSDALCTAQGFIKQFSMTGSSYFTSAIAIHTFTTLACRRRLPDWLCGVAVVSGWSIAAVMSIIPAMINDGDLGLLYGFDGMACGISLAYPALQLFFQVIPVFLAISASLLFYTLVYLVLRGTISTSSGLRLNFRTEDRKRSLDMDGTDPKYQHFILTVARSLLLYPVAFIVLNFADMVSVLLEVAGNQTLPFWLHVFGDSTVGMLGFANAAILLNTLRIIAPFIKGCVLSNPQNADSESFFAPSSSPVDPPAKSLFSTHNASLSFDSTCKADTFADGYLTAPPVAHVSSRRRSRIDLSSAMAALRPSSPSKRSSRPQTPDNTSSPYFFPRAITAPRPVHWQHSKIFLPGSPRPTPLGLPHSDGNGKPPTTRHKPPPLEEPLRTPRILPTVTIVGPKATDASERSPEPRIVHQEAAHPVITSPPHSAALICISRPASLVDPEADPQPQFAAMSSAQPKSASATNSLISLQTIPARESPTAALRASVPSNGGMHSQSSRVPSIASTSFRGLPQNPRALRAACEDVAAGAQMKRHTPSPLSGGSTTSNAPPVVSSSSQSGSAIPVFRMGMPSSARSSTATSGAQSAPPLRGGIMPDKPTGTLSALPRSQSSNGIRGPRSPNVSVVRPSASSANANSTRPSAEVLSARTPSMGSLKSPSTVSLVGDGGVPLLGGRKPPARHSSRNAVFVSQSDYI